MTKLSPRELEVVCCLTLGMSNKEIASTLGISELTVETHIRNSRDKIGAENKIHLVVWMYKDYLRSLDGNSK